MSCSDLEEGCEVPVDLFCPLVLHQLLEIGLAALTANAQHTRHPVHMHAVGNRAIGCSGHLLADFVGESFDVHVDVEGGALGVAMDAATDEVMKQLHPGQHTHAYGRMACFCVDMWIWMCLNECRGLHGYLLKQWSSSSSMLPISWRRLPCSACTCCWKSIPNSVSNSATQHTHTE